jgi:photosystem II stability/assembly factor-like uncharacterized protein
MYFKLRLLIYFLFFTLASNAQWKDISNGLDNSEVNVLAVNGKTIFAGTSSGIYKTTSSENHWSAANNGLSSLSVPSIVANNNLVFAASNDGVFISKDNGLSWIPYNSGLTNLHVSSLTVSGAAVFAVTDDGIFVTTNNNTGWSVINEGLTHINAYSYTISNSVLFVGSCGVYMSKDNGRNWDNVSEGLPDFTSNSLVTCENTVYVATSGGGIFSRSIDEMLTLESFKTINAIIETRIYPNPFSNSATFEINETTVPKALLDSKDKTLIIYDLLGREVNCIKELNQSKTIIERGNMPNGVYFYKLTVQSKPVAIGKFIIE